jgi:ribosomal-protein-alanine N-acetyltransferase
MVEHCGTKTIETERLILRRFMMDDAQALFNNWANDPVVTQYLTWTPHKNIETTKAVLTIWVNAYEHADNYHWAIVRKQDAKLIGSISAVNIDDTYEQCEIGYCLAKDYWNQGIMTEAVKAVIAYLFMTVNFNRVQAIHQAQNTASGRVMVKAGMRYEGRLRQYLKDHQGRFVDCVIYAILHEDFLKATGER